MSKDGSGFHVDTNASVGIPPSTSMQQMQQQSANNPQAYEQMYPSQEIQYEQPQMLPYSQSAGSQYIQTLQYVRQNELQLQEMAVQGTQAGHQQLSQPEILFSNEPAEAFNGNFDMYGEQPNMLMPLDEQSLQRLLQRQQYEQEEQALIQMQQGQLNQQTQMQWQYRYSRDQQEQWRQQEQARQKQERLIHQQQMKQQQQLRSQKFQHQQRHQLQRQQEQQFCNLQSSFEEERRWEQREQVGQLKLQKEWQKKHSESLLQQQHEDEGREERMNTNIKIKKDCWQRQQMLLDQQDDEESVYDLEKTIARPNSVRSNIKSTPIQKDPAGLDESQNQELGIKFNMDSVTDALSLLDAAVRLRIPEYTAETLQKQSFLPKGHKEHFVRQAIASRQMQRCMAEDFATVHHSFSVNTDPSDYTGTQGRPLEGHVDGIIPSSIYQPLQAGSQKKPPKKSDTLSSRSNLSFDPYSTIVPHRDTYGGVLEETSTLGTSTFASRSRKSAIQGKSMMDTLREEANKVDDIDGMSVNLKGLSVSISYETEEIKQDEETLSAQATNVSNKESTQTVEKKSSTSRSREQSKNNNRSNDAKKHAEKKHKSEKELKHALENAMVAHPTLEISHIATSQATLPFAWTNPTFEETAGESIADKSIPSLRLTDAFTVSSCKPTNSSGKAHSPSPSSVLMSYTMSDNEESVTSMRRNIPEKREQKSGTTRSKNGRSTSTEGKNVGKGKPHKAGQSSYISEPSNGDPKEPASPTFRVQGNEEHESYTTSSDTPIEPSESRREYTKSSTRSSDLDDDVSMPFTSDDNEEIGSGSIMESDSDDLSTCSRSYRRRHRLSIDEEYPEIDRDLSRPFSSEYEETSYDESELRDRPSSPRQHPAMADYEARNIKLREEEESYYSGRSPVSVECDNRYALVKRNVSPFSDRNSIETRHMESCSMSNMGAAAIQSAYATMTKSLKRDKHEKSHIVAKKGHQKNTKEKPVNCGFQFDEINNNEDDLDQWLESAMATKSMDDGCTLDPRHFGDTDDDLDAWLDNVICR